MIKNESLKRLSLKTKLVKLFLKFKLKTVNNEKNFDISAARAMRKKNMTKVCGKPIANVKIEKVTLTEYPAYFYTPQTVIDSEWVVLFLHGGAFVASDIDIYNGFVSRFSDALKLKAYSFDYPLAPEKQYPDNMLAVAEFYKKLIENGQKPEKIILTGDSAGGNLALSAAKHLQKEGIRLPGLLALFSPWVDLTLNGETIRTNAKKDLMITYNLLDNASKLYCGDHDRTDPGVSPVFGEYSEFPPVYILAADDELLLSECIQMHNALEQSGVEVLLAIWKDAQHAFIVGMSFFPESKVVMKSIKEFIYEHCKFNLD